MKDQDFINVNFCIYEDRPEDFIAVKILIMSICKKYPNSKIYMMGKSCANIDFNEKVNEKYIIRIPEFSPKSSGWNVKAECLLFLLENYVDDVTWIDSDMIFLRPLPEQILREDMSCLVVAEEPRSVIRQGSRYRTEAWGLEPGQVITRTINNCILRATKHHESLLLEYMSMLHSQEFVDAQKKPFHLRERHLAGSQDALTALIGSKKYQNLPIRWVRSGKEIAQCFGPDGFSILDRIYCMINGGPSVVHAQGPKPWKNLDHRPLYLELSPYIYFAKEYTDYLEMENLDWTTMLSRTGKTIDILAFKNPYLRGMPIIFIHKIKNYMRRAKSIPRKIAQFSRFR
ncbi:MAG: hypothetical protein ACTS10_06655 [Kiloniellales bacterium]